jgi:Raf kinase inhibitor-like YbhB/YbcL family protein
MRNILKVLSVLSLIVSTPLFAASLTLSSEDIAQGEFMPKAQEYNGFGCSGGDFSPHLKWSNAPKGTKSYAITAYDADAPTGSGWWHWQVVNIPITVMEISTGAGNTKTNSAPTGSKQIQNDFGSRGFGDACPPKGHGVHHYRFTVYALSVDKLELSEDASGALAGYMINAHTIESSTIEALYKRD